MTLGIRLVVVNGYGRYKLVTMYIRLVLVNGNGRHKLVTVGGDSV